MEKKEYSQLDLFSETPDVVQKRNTRQTLIGFARAYEKIVLLAICLIIVVAIAFSLGIEKGKKLVIPADVAVIDKQPQSTPLTITETVDKEIIPPVENNEKKQTGYVIQLASYQGKSYAEKEAQKLSKKGFTPLILSKGRYNILCIGNFDSKTKAQSVLTKLKKQYRDSFIRRL